METLVGIIVLALVMAAIAPFARQAAESLGTLSREETRLYAIAKAYDLFRSSCALSAAPPWVASDEMVSIDSRRATVAYLGGKADEMWSIAVSEDGLVVEARGDRIEIQADRPRVGRIDSGNRIVGIEASFEAMGRTCTWKGYFGAPGY